MSAIVKTNLTVLGNYASNDAYILITKKKNAMGLDVLWNNYISIVWENYTITETDFRVKTATFSTPQYIDLTTSTYAIMITTPLHEDFGGVIIDVEYDADTGMYNYQCQDWSRVYQGKIDVVSTNKTVHRLLQFLITQGGVSLVGSVSKAQLNQYKKVLSGLRPAHQYYQRSFGSIFDFNPMTVKSNKIIRGKSWIEAIRDLVYGTGAYIDVYFDKYGRIQIEPYHKDDFFNTGLLLTANELSSYTQSFDTTNIITGVTVQNTDKKNSGKHYTSRDLVSIDLSAIFGNLTTTMDNPNQTTTNTTTPVKSATKSAAKANKKSNTKTKTVNPYKTKKKEIWLNSDNITGPSSDMKFLKDMAAILQKNGWKTKIVGVGSHTHEEGYANVKGGIWCCVYGGIDAACIREACIKSSYRNKLDRNQSRTVFCMRPPASSILKGGKYYKYLSRAHDDDYSPSSFKGISQPLKWMTKYKVPIMYAKNAKQMAAKFLAGGDNPEAC